jgi:hypothetical protein
LERGIDDHAVIEKIRQTLPLCKIMRDTKLVSQYLDSQQRAFSNGFGLSPFYHYLYPW